MEGPARVLLHDLLDGITPLQLAGDPSVDVRTVEHDSRRVHPGACFACVPGATTDGHVHAPAAVAAGAVALLVERPLGLGVAEARVPDVRAVLGPVAARLHDQPSRSMRCAGVTGTNGKTTTTYLLHTIARAAGEPSGLIGTTGVRITTDALDRLLPARFTTPEASDLQMLLAEMRDAGVARVALEVSSHALAQHRVDGTWFDTACFTNLSHDHLDYHGTMEEYFEAKARLFAPGRCGVAITNLDDPHGVRIARRAHSAGVPVVTFALDDFRADFGASSVRLGATGATFVLVDRRRHVRLDVATPMVGRVNVRNALAAAATALAGGESDDAVVHGLAQVPVVPGRLERVDAGQPFTVLVDYAHSPDALGHAVAAARALAGGKRVAVVFGCGGDRDAQKRPAMGAAAASADLVIVTSDNPRNEDPVTIAMEAVRGATDAGAEPLVELDRRAAIRLAVGWAQPGDVVLLAGKGHESGQTVAGHTVPFDDRIVARQELEAAGCG